MTRTPSTRRAFLASSSLAAAATATAAFPWSQPGFANESANDRPRIGCIGVGSMGSGDARQHAQFGDILAVCDVDSDHAERAQNEGQIGKGKADLYIDYRRVLERDDIDVVSVVTPDHWHVKIAIEALQAGKHVFCQKPLTLTLEENQLIRNACRKYDDRVFLVGTQQRGSHNRFLRAINMVQKGLLGDIKKVVVGINGAPTGGPFPVAKPPGNLDWDMWLGQAPQVDYREKRCHYEFRWWYEYSGGKFTDWGAHHVDIATGQSAKTVTAKARSKLMALTQSIRSNSKTGIRSSTTSTTRLTILTLCAGMPVESKCTLKAVATTACCLKEPKAASLSVEARSRANRLKRTGMKVSSTRTI